MSGERSLRARVTASVPGAGDAARPARVGRGHSPTGLAEWYLELAPCWLNAEPALRCRLILEIHGWIAERVFGRADPTLSAALGDLGPGGVLARRLTALIPAPQRDGWRDWVGLALRDLRRALLRPPDERDEAWAHVLFLIPYNLAAGHVTAGPTGRAPVAGQ